MKVLIVYENIPEDTKFYSVEVDAKEWAWMATTHGHFVNAEMDKKTAKACDQLSTYLESKKPFEATTPILMRGESYDYVLHTGFVL